MAVRISRTSCFLTADEKSRPAGSGPLPRNCHARKTGGLFRLIDAFRCPLNVYSTRHQSPGYYYTNRRMFGVCCGERMIDIDLTIDQLMPDFRNPRIGDAKTRLDALNRIVMLQRSKLVNLALSISERGLSPIERLLVIKDPAFPDHNVVIEGNRRAATLILMTNPRLISSLEAFNATPELNRIQARLSEIASKFARSRVEPIRAVLAVDRAATQYWVQLRHNGEGDGVGVTRWRTVESLRFADPSARLVVVADLLFSEGELSHVEKEMFDDLPWTTFDRFIDSPRLREILCFEVINGVFTPSAPRHRVITALREIAFRVASGEYDSRKQNSVDDRISALMELPNGVLPPRIDGSTGVPEDKGSGEKPSGKRSGGSTKSESGSTGDTKRSRSERPQDRLFRRTDFTIIDTRISQILKELSELPVSSKPNACAVLLRVFLEMSVLHYLNKQGVGTTSKGGQQAELYVLVERTYDKMKMLDDTMAMPEIEALIAARTTGTRMRELHSYVHNRHQFPAPSDLIAAANELSPLLKKIWS